MLSHGPPPVPVFQYSPLQVFAARFHRRIAAVLLRRARRGIEAPDLLAGGLIIGGDIAARAEIRPALADDHLAVEHARRAGDGLHRLVSGTVCDAPEQLAGLGVERDQPAVQRGGENPPVGIGHAAIDGKAVDASWPD